MRGNYVIKYHFISLVRDVVNVKINMLFKKHNTLLKGGVVHEQPDDSHQ